MLIQLIATIILGMLVIAASPGYAGVDPGDLCKEAKAKAAGKKAVYLLKAFGRFVKNWDRLYLGRHTGRTHGKGQDKLTRRFMTAEIKGGCETTDDWVAVGARVDAFVDDVLPDLLPRGFVDNGDGTITDPWTGLMWEKKDQAGGLHDVDNTYQWARRCCLGQYPDCDYRYCQPTAAAAAVCSAHVGSQVGCTQCPEECGTSGNTIWMWLLEVNSEGGTGFAGYSDWRIPSVKKGVGKPELETIVRIETLPCSTQPCVEPAFDTNCTEGCTTTTCSCTAPALYLSSRTLPPSPDTAMCVEFDSGKLGAADKRYLVPVRAVRGPD